MPVKPADKTGSLTPFTGTKAGSGFMALVGIVYWLQQAAGLLPF